eukprot:1146532-Pelagomonas_calceolata.AAC.1
MCTGAAAPAVGGGKCWCWTGRGSRLRLCLVGVAGQPHGPLLAVAAVAPAALAPTAAACVGGGAGTAAVTPAADAHAAAVTHVAAVRAGGGAGEAAACAAGGGGLQSSCLNCCPSWPALRCRKGLPGLGTACRQVLAEGVGNQLPLPKFDQDSCPPGGLHHQFLPIPTLIPGFLLHLDGNQMKGGTCLLRLLSCLQRSSTPSKAH